MPIAFAAGVDPVPGSKRGARLADQLDPDLEGRTLAIAGARRFRAAGRWRRACVSGSSPRAAADLRLPRTIELTWYEPDWRPLPAERLALEVKLRRPRGFANPGGSDYVARMLREGVGATGYVRSATRDSAAPRMTC